MPQMTVSLERSIDKLNEDLMSIFTTLHTGEFVDPACDPEVVLERLGEVHTQLELAGSTGAGGATGGVASASAVAMAANAITLAIQARCWAGVADLAWVSFFRIIGRVTARSRA